MMPRQRGRESLKRRAQRDDASNALPLLPLDPNSPSEQEVWIVDAALARGYKAPLDLWTPLRVDS